MKKIFFSLIILLCAGTLLAQNNEGVINYTEITKIELPEDVKQRMKERGITMDIPDESKEKMTLHFTSTASLYQASKDQEEQEIEVGGGRGGRTRTIRFGGNNNSQYYRNVKEGSKKHLRNLMGKDFRIEDEEEKITWKISGKTTQLGQYQVMEATYQNEKDTVSAWFTPQIPVSTGPGKYGQLPGLILRVDINYGKRVIEANEIELRSLEEGELTEPTDGKKVTQAQYVKIREDKIEEMKEMYGEERAKRFSRFIQ